MIYESVYLVIENNSVHDHKVGTLVHVLGMTHVDSLSYLYSTMKSLLQYRYSLSHITIMPFVAALAAN